MPYAAIIIPHYNDNDRLGRCLDALIPQVETDGGIEVLVVDNGSDAPPRIAHPAVRCVTEAQKGAANARNRGVAESAAPRLWFLDCDCVPADDWLKIARSVAERADLVGGTITVFDETPPPRTGAEAFEAVFAFDNRGYVETRGFSVTANLLTTRAAFDAVGGFEHGVSEDLDWCRRATAAGFGLVHEDGLRVAHPSRGDWAALRRKWRRLTDESWALEGRDVGSRAKWAARALAMPVSVLAHAPRVLRHPELRAGERRAALATLARLRLTRAGWMLHQAAGRDPS